MSEYLILYMMSLWSIIFLPLVIICLVCFCLLKRFIFLDIWYSTFILPGKWFDLHFFMNIWVVYLISKCVGLIGSWAIFKIWVLFVLLRFFLLKCIVKILCYLKPTFIYSAKETIFILVCHELTVSSVF